MAFPGAGQVAGPTTECPRAVLLAACARSTGEPWDLPRVVAAARSAHRGRIAKRRCVRRAAFTVKIHLPSVGIDPRWSSIPDFALQLRDQRVEHDHVVVDEPDEADLLLYVECHQVPKDWRLRSVSESPAARRYPYKVAVYNERDDPWCRYPGIYMSMPQQSFHRSWQVAGCYRNITDPATLVEPVLREREPDLLFSFVGSITHPCRKALFGLAGPRRHVEGVEGFVFWDARSRDFEQRRSHFANVLFRSAFVLCPRGHGTGSIRLFETCAAGRVPVILADDWVPPAGPDWDSFSLRWPEQDVAGLPGALEELEGHAVAMGRRARAAFDSYFAPDVVLAHQLNALEPLVLRPERRRFPARGYRDYAYLHLCARDLKRRLRDMAFE